MKTKILFSLFVILLLGVSNLSVSGALPDNLNVAMDLSHGESEDEAENFKGNLTAAGSEFNYLNTFTLADGVNVLLVGAAEDAFTAAELTAVFDWFNGDGAHLVWISGSDDFGGFFIPDHSNALLAKLESKLRISAEAVNDYVANDGSGYRLMGNVMVKDGTINKVLTEGVNSAIFHGSAYVLGYENNAVVDLRTETIEGVEVVVKTSTTAYFKDQDLSEGVFDYYGKSGLKLENVSVPLMAVEDMGSNDFVIVAGEANWLDIRNKYGLLSEYNTQDSGWGAQEGKVLTDNIMTWFGEEVSAGEKSSDDGFLPFSFYFALAGLALIPILRRKFRN